MEARPPEREAIMPRLILISRAYQLAHDPESLVRITRSGSRGDSSQVMRCGFTGLAGCVARSSRVFHQLAKFDSIFLRHAPSRFWFKSGNNALSVSAASPTRLTSIG